MKFCKDCKHYKYEFGTHVCEVIIESNVDPVTGFGGKGFCLIRRKEGKPCSPTAELFKPKEPDQMKSLWQNIKTFFRKG